MRHNIREILNAGYSLRRDRAAPVTSAMASVAAVQGRAKVPVINRMTILSGLIKFSDPAPEILDGYSTAHSGDGAQAVIKIFAVSERFELLKGFDIERAQDLGELQCGVGLENPVSRRGSLSVLDNSISKGIRSHRFAVRDENR